MTSTAHVDFDPLLGARRRAARSELAAAMRMLSADSDPEGAAAAEPLPEDAYFEPRLFCQLEQGGFASMTLAQLLFSDNPVTSDRCAVTTDGSGIASFPGFGRCATGLPGATTALRYSEALRAFTDEDRTGDAGEPVRYALDPSAFVPGTRIEIVEHVDPVLGRFLANHVERSSELVLVDDPRAFTAGMSRALGLIGAVLPEYHAALVESLRGVLLFRHPTAESFAALGMHGMVFLNVPPNAGTDYFVEEFTHQGGHVLFSEATLSRGDFFRDDPDAPLAGFLGRDDPRSVYDAFHGLYTEHMESRVVTAVLDRGLATDDEDAGFRAHLAAVAGRHAHDLGLIGAHASEIFSDAGREVHAAFQESHASRTAAGTGPLPGQ